MGDEDDDEEVVNDEEMDDEEEVDDNMEVDDADVDDANEGEEDEAAGCAAAGEVSDAVNDSSAMSEGVHSKSDSTYIAAEIHAPTIMPFLRAHTTTTKKTHPQQY